MQITPTSLNYVFNQFNLLFQGAYSETAPWWDQIATRKPSVTETETYVFTSRVAQMREWVGERQMRSVGTYALQIANRDFEDSIEVDRNKIEDDQYGVFDFMFQDLGRAARKWPDTLILNVLNNGQSQLAYDGANFFDTAHPIDRYPGQLQSGLGNQRNYWASGMGLTFDNYLNVRATMMSYVGEDNLPLGVIPDTLVVAPQNEVIAKLIATGESVAPQQMNSITQVGANVNVLKGTCKVLVLPELSPTPGAWFLADCSKKVKPFVFQDRQAPNVISLRDPTNENVFKRKKYLFGVDTRGASLGGMWFLAAKASA
jgi:phage major head subunit gpT-like protein